MNFYQRANLSMSLAILLGAEVAIVGFLQKNTLDTSKYTELICILFQFLFRLKITLDDHDHFNSFKELTRPRDANERKNRSPSDSHRFCNFFFFSVAGIVFVLAAATSFKLSLSLTFFLIALGISTIWSFIEACSNACGCTTDGEDYFPGVYIAFNLLYVLVIIIWLCHDTIDDVHIALPILLFFILCGDFVCSKTMNKMP